MIERVKAYIDREIGLEPHAQLFVALSGGADSTALLLIMKELGYKLKALHCNFHLRGEESNRDQTFVEELCKQNRIPLTVRHFETADHAKQQGISIEMAARELRYSWFHEQAAFVAVAHHRDDQAETLLLNLLRGTGLRGMAGMQPRHDGIIRPLLCLSREEILAYLQSRGQAYVTDSTNSERTCLRNRIRLDVIPMLRDINPAAVEHLCRAQDNVRHSLPYYRKGIEAAFLALGITEEHFPLSALKTLTSQPKVDGQRESQLSPLLHEWLTGKGFNGAQEEEMLQAAKSHVGRLWTSATHKVLRDREALIQTPIRNPKGEALPQIRRETVPSIGETGPNVAYFDADLITKPIAVRRVRQGDTFVPFGMTGRKLVSDYLTDVKLNRFEKAETFVATHGDDIIWLIGHRSDDRYKVTDATKRILKLSTGHC